MTKQYWPWMAARLFLGGVFIFAGFLKLSAPVEVFRGMIVSYGILPYGLVGPVAHIIPWVEFLAGTCLFIGYLPRIFTVVLGMLAFSFIALIAAAKLHGTLPENCGCFGEGIHMSPYQMALLDLINVLISVRLFQIKKHLWCIAA